MADGRARYGTIEERLWGNVQHTEAGCWILETASSRKVPRVWLDGRSRVARIVAYELAVGDVPAGAGVRPTCEQDRCVNPAHLTTDPKPRPVRVARPRKVPRHPGSLWCPTEDGCERAECEDDWCEVFKAHLLAWLINSAVLVEPPDDPLARPVEGPCWVGVGTLNQKGYANRMVGRRPRKMHRIALAVSGAPIRGTFGDHLCRRRDCFNPAHLEPTTQAENTLRGVSPGALNAAKTECIRGHDLTDPTNVRIYNGRRHCKACRRTRSATTARAGQEGVGE